MELSQRIGPTHVLALKHTYRKQRNEILQSNNKSKGLQQVGHLQSFDQTIGQLYGIVGAVDLLLKA